MIDKSLAAFNECKKAIDEAMKEIKDKMPDLYKHLQESIKMDENNRAFSYCPEEQSLE